MAIPSFYHSQLVSEDKTISLDVNESAHAVKSRRLKLGQVVRVFNGDGLVANGVLSIIERRDVTVELESFEQFKRPERAISVAVAIPKGDRQKTMVDMLTQLGIFEIIPLRCDRSIAKYGQNTSQKWARAAIEACKQSQNPWLPRISSELSLDELLADEGRHFVFASGNGLSLDNSVEHPCDLTVLIGPEGGFSEREFAKFDQFSVPSISIGPYILRTEVAAVAAASVLAA